MTSQGQRFRRRALRRGYKVDEVDAFLDRVEATLAGEQVGAPVGRPGGPRRRLPGALRRLRRVAGRPAPRPGRAAARRARGARRPAPRPADVPGPCAAAGPARPRDGAPTVGMPDRGCRTVACRIGGMPAEARSACRTVACRTGWHRRSNRAAPPTERLPATRPRRRVRPRRPVRHGDDRPMAPRRRWRPGRSRPCRHRAAPTRTGVTRSRRVRPAAGPAAGSRTTRRHGGYDGFEPGRHGKSDMTAEIRMPDRDPRGRRQRLRRARRR